MYCQSIHHILFSTIEEEDTILHNGRKVLFKFIWEQLKNKNCELYRINNGTNHIHLLVDVSSLVPLDAFVKDLKRSSSAFIGESYLFPDFAGWQENYYAFSHSLKEKNEMINYVKKQDEIHEKQTFQEEINYLLKTHEFR